MQLQLVIWLLFPTINLELVNSLSCQDYEFNCPWDEDTFKIYTRWSWKKVRCEMSNTQNVNKRMIDKCENLGTCDNSTTWYEDDGAPAMGCSVPRELIDYNADVCDVSIGTVGDLTHLDEYSVFFNDVCVMHDICYRSNNTKVVCDGEFFRNMLSMCRYAYKAPQTRYPTLFLGAVHCPLYAFGFNAAVVKRGGAAYGRGQEFYQNHSCLSNTQVTQPLTDHKPLTDEEIKIEIEKYYEDILSRDNPNNEPIFILNVFLGTIITLLCCIIFCQCRTYCIKEKSINYSKVLPYNTDSEADVLVNVN